MKISFEISNFGILFVCLSAKSLDFEILSTTLGEITKLLETKSHTLIYMSKIFWSKHICIMCFELDLGSYTIVSTA